MRTKLDVSQSGTLALSVNESALAALLQNFNSLIAELDPDDALNASRVGLVRNVKGACDIAK